jgi:hypothetical protein
MPHAENVRVDLGRYDYPPLGVPPVRMATDAAHDRRHAIKCMRIHALESMSTQALTVRPGEIRSL